MTKHKSKYEIIGCDHSFVHETPSKRCDNCNLKRTDNECIDNIACGERYYVYLKTEG